MVKKNLLKIKEYLKVKQENENNSSFLKTCNFFENKLYKRNTIKQLEEKYFVSIIMPAFNRRKIISNAIDSVLNQYFKNYEIIIVDDGSNDNSEEFIKEKYLKFFKKNKIKYFKINHQGVSAARNIGLNHASGNVIAYLDSDNQWNSKYLNTMLLDLDSKDYHCAYCNVNIINQNTGMEYTLNHDFNRKKILESSFIDLNGFIHKKQLYDDLKGFDEELSRLVDWDLIIKYTKNNTPLHINETLVNCFLSSELNNITFNEPLNENIDKIHQKYWLELYSDEYNAIREYFDEEYYLDNYENELNNLNPIYHFLTTGHKENKNPNKEFITSYYKNKYPEVVRYHLNPLVHYAKWGKKEGREINYFKKRNSIINNNLIYLSNYEFDYEPLVSIIILNRNGFRYLKRLFEDFTKKTNYSNYEIIVVDNNSSDNSVNFLKTLKELNIKIIENKENVSFSKGNNEGVKIANGEYILLLNNDIEPTYGWLNEMMGTIIYNENVGAVGAKLIFPYFEDEKQLKYSFTLQHTGDIIKEKNNERCLYVAQNQNRFSPNIFDNNVSVNKKRILVTGAALLTKKEIYTEIDGLDEDYWYGYEDVDFNLKLHEKGYDVIFASAALLFHYESATPREIKCPNNYTVLCDKWGEYLFKNLLKDKLEKKYLFTDKTLHFLFVIDNDFTENKMKNQIHSLTKFFNNEQYNTSLKLDINDLKIDFDVDIIISFTSNFDVKNAISRKNLIKILILNDGNYVKNDFENWDIILCGDEDCINMANSNDKLIYQDLNKLNENIIPILYERFLNDKN